jgi:hypothetical protein
VMESDYVEHLEMDIRLQDTRRYEDLRMRADGSPSASPPHPVLPLKHWATIQGDPAGALKKNGLYDGPTALTFVRKENEDEDESA